MKSGAGLPLVASSEACVSGATPTTTASTVVGPPAPSMRSTLRRHRPSLILIMASPRSDLGYANPFHV